MTETNVLPNAALIFKIVPHNHWSEARERGLYLGSRDDRRDGFIHLSAAHQVIGTLSKHFRSQDDLLLIAFKSDKLGTELKWEVSRDGELFPHLYGPLPTALALWQRSLPLGSDGIPRCEEAWLAC